MCNGKTCLWCMWIAKCHAICDSTKENCKTNSYCFTSFFPLWKKVKHNLWLSKHVPIFLIHKKVVKMRYKRSFKMPKKCMRTKKKTCDYPNWILHFECVIDEVTPCNYYFSTQCQFIWSARKKTVHGYSIPRMQP